MSTTDEVLAAGDLFGGPEETLRVIDAAWDHFNELLGAGGVSVDDLAAIAGLALERWRQQQPDPDDPGERFRDRSLRLEKTFGGAAVPRGDLSPSRRGARGGAAGPGQAGRPGGTTGASRSGSTTPSSSPAPWCPASAA